VDRQQRFQYNQRFPKETLINEKRLGARPQDAPLMFGKRLFKIGNFGVANAKILPCRL
jgi:hypothetical protein